MVDNGGSGSSSDEREDVLGVLDVWACVYSAGGGVDKIGIDGVFTGASDGRVSFVNRAFFFLDPSPSL